METPRIYLGFPEPQCKEKKQYNESMQAIHEMFDAPVYATINYDASAPLGELFDEAMFRI